MRVVGITDHAVDKLCGQYPEVACKLRRFEQVRYIRRRALRSRLLKRVGLYEIRRQGNMTIVLKNHPEKKKHVVITLYRSKRRVAYSQGPRYYDRQPFDRWVQEEIASWETGQVIKKSHVSRQTTHGPRRGEKPQLQNTTTGTESSWERLVRKIKNRFL